MQDNKFDECVGSRQQFSALVFMCVIVSFIGFCVENIWISFFYRYMDNRNMILPFLFGYGLGMMAIFLMFGTPQKPRIFRKRLSFRRKWAGVIYFYIMVCIFVSIGEIALGTLVEEVCNVTWWEYTTLPLHITKFTSVPTTFGFGALMTLFMYFVFPSVYHRFLRIKSRMLFILSILLIIILTLDIIHTGYIMYTTENFFIIWRIDF